MPPDGKNKKALCLESIASIIAQEWDKRTIHPSDPARASINPGPDGETLRQLGILRFHPTKKNRIFVSIFDLLHLYNRDTIPLARRVKWN